MRKRVILLLGLLILRIFIGYLVLPKFDENRQITVTGNVVKAIQIDNKCIMDLGIFSVKLVGPCKVTSGKNIKVVGSPKRSLIEALGGKIALEKATIVDTEKYAGKVMSQADEQSVFGRFMDYCRNIYQSFLPRDESALLAGIVLGDKTSIGYDFYQKMVKSGTIHIAVASGYNLMLVGGTVLSLLFWLFKRREASVVTIVVMALYAVLAGFEPPVVRALFMASLIYICAVLGRKTDAIWFLFLSGFGMLIWDPGMLFSVSFQLSVMASVGLMVLAPWVQEWFIKKNMEKEGEGLEKFGLITTVCTMLATAPIIWWHFGRISIMGLFSNIFVLPLVPPVMILGAFMLLIPSLFFVPTYALVHLMVLIINFFGS